MNIYITTDTHFGHQAIIDRGFRPEDFEKKILDGFKNLKRNDLLIHLGDVGFTNKKALTRIFKKIKCKKVLCKGNHDKKSNSWFYDVGFDFVGQYFVDRCFGKRVLFSHIPIRDLGQYDYNICGHFHDNQPTRYEAQFLAIYDKQKHILLALERNDYKLFSLKQVLREKQ